MNASQCRMARAALKMGVRELALLADVSTNTITRFEAQAELRERTIRAIQTALELQGVAFIERDHLAGSGVRFAVRPAWA